MSADTNHSLQLQNIQALRGIAVLAVVLTHLVSVEQKYAGDRLMGDFFSVGLSGVDLFFAISGFVMVYVAWNIPGGFRPALSFLFARVGRIYPLYWLVSLVVLGVWLIRPDLVFASIAKVNLIGSFTLWPTDVPPLLAVGWTLIHEMYFYLVFTVLLLLVPRVRLWGLLVWAVFILAGIVAGWGGRDPIWYTLVHPLSFEFLGGMFAAFALKRFSGRYWEMALLVGSILFMWVSFLSLRLGPPFWQDWVRAAGYAPTMALLVYGAVGAEKSGKVFHGFFIMLGNQSYALYLSHVLVLSTAGRLWAKIAFGGLWDNFIVLPLALGLAIVVAEGLHRVIEQPSLNYIKRLRKKLF
jgi:exopolysaccharide production protein ExoZ